MFYPSSVHGSLFANCTDGDIKLSGGSTPYEGTVLVCMNNAWGTVCDDYWGPEEAQVVCNAMDYSAQGNKDLERYLINYLIYAYLTKNVHVLSNVYRTNFSVENFASKMDVHTN